MNTNDLEIITHGAASFAHVMAPMPEQGGRTTAAHIAIKIRETYDQQNHRTKAVIEAMERHPLTAISWHNGKTLISPTAFHVERYMTGVGGYATLSVSEESVEEYIGKPYDQLDPTEKEEVHMYFKYQ
jgi:hypothetical protein